MAPINTPQLVTGAAARKHTASIVPLPLHQQSAASTATSQTWYNALARDQCRQRRVKGPLGSFGWMQPLYLGNLQVLLGLLERLLGLYVGNLYTSVRWISGQYLVLTLEFGYGDPCIGTHGILRLLAKPRVLVRQIIHKTSRNILLNDTQSNHLKFWKVLHILQFRS